jgi:hypothetical protein
MEAVLSIAGQEPTRQRQEPDVVAERCGDDPELDPTGDGAVLRLPVTGTWRPIAVASIGVRGSHPCSWWRSMSSRPSRRSEAVRARARFRRDDPNRERLGRVGPGAEAHGPERDVETLVPVPGRLRYLMVDAPAT